MRIPALIQGQGGVLTDIPPTVHSLHVPARAVPVGIFQIVVRVASVVADVRIPTPIQGQGGVPAQIKHPLFAVHRLDMPARGILVGVLQVIVCPPVGVADVRIPALIQGQGGEPADLSLTVHGLDVPTRGVPVGILQVGVGVVVVADVRIPVLIQGQGGILTDIPPTIHGLDVPAGGVLVGVLQGADIAEIG